MVTTPNYDLDIDTTLGGSSASDYVIPSQKAIKAYVDNNSGSTVDQTYDPTSQAAQSGVAIAGANFLQNIATGTDSLAVLSSNSNNRTMCIGYNIGSVSEYSIAIGSKTAASGVNSLAIGYEAKTSGLNGCTAIGYSSNAQGKWSTAIGDNAKTTGESATALGLGSVAGGKMTSAVGYYAKTSADYAIQIGKGTNSTASTLAIGFNGTNYELLDGTTGLIPDARISTNIARTTAIPTDISDLTDDTTTYPIDKAESVVDNNSGSLKFWSGTQAQYDALVNNSSIDADTLYNITDNVSIPISILEALYPVGAIYIGTMNACPLQTLGVGTWTLVAQDRVLQGAGSRGAVGTTISESLPAMYIVNTGVLTVDYGLTKTSGYKDRVMVTSAAGQAHYEQPSTYQDGAPVQPDGYLVNIWERTA